MAYRSDVMIVMDMHTFDQFNELKKEYDFYNYTIHDRFNVDDVELVCIGFNSIKWYEMDDPFIIKWIDYLNSHSLRFSDELDYYEIVIIGEDENDNQHHSCGKYSSKFGYFLDIERTIKLYKQ